jgi:DNA-binding beta-propeller fold protein YncE
MSRRLRLVVFLAAVIGLTGCGGGAVVRPPLTFVGNLALSHDAGVAAAIDLLSIDARGGRLYVPHTSRNALEVVDLAAGKLARSVGGLPGIKAVAVLPNSSTVFTSDGADSAVGVVDASTGKLLNRIALADQPDAIEYDAVKDVVVVSLPASHSVALIDRTSLTVTASISLPGTPELMAIDPISGRLFVAINDKDEVAVVDLAAAAVDRLFRSCDIKAPTGLAYDSERGRLFVASDGALNVIDVVLEKCLGVVDVGRGVDQIALDPGTHHLYAPSTGSGNLALIDLGSMQPLGVVGTAPGARGIAVNPLTHRLYVAVARAGLVAVYHDP